MKFRSLFLSALCGLAVSTAFTSCSDDDPYDPYEYGSKVALPEHRGLVLNEGSYGMNNTTISFFDAAKDTTTKATNDLYFIQNKKQLGDTGQDIIVEDNNIYVCVYGSSYVTKLNKAGVEQARREFGSDLGQPRYMAECDGFVYVTTYGGFVVKLNANDLSVAGKVKVGPAAERIDEENSILYVACGNTLDYTSDKRMFIIDTKNFTDASVKSVDVCDNTQLVCATDKYVFIQGYGADWTNTPFWVYDIKSGKAEDTGLFATYAIATNDDNKAFTVYSKTVWSADWTTSETVNTYFVYDAATKTKTDVTSKITSAVSELASASIYALSEGENGSFYIATTLYGAGNGTVYHFDSNYKLLGSFTSWGQNPKKVVVM